MAETPGSILRFARESQHLNIAQVAKATRIRSIYIQALEEDSYDLLPSNVHVRGFLRGYAKFLRLDPDSLISLLENKPKGEEASSSKIPLSQKEDPKSTDKLIIGTSGILRKPLETLKAPIESKDPNQIGGDEKNQDQELERPLISDSNRSKRSQTLFLVLGEQLRKQRESLGLSLEEVEHHSHVRKHYLRSIEEGTFKDLPTSVQARGMLINYARFLELTQDVILLQYAEALQVLRFEQQPDNQEKISPSNGYTSRFLSLRRYFSIDLIFGGGLIILLVVFAFWGTGKVIDLYNPQRSAATPASISDILLTPLLTITSEFPVDTQEPEMVTNLTTPSLELATGAPSGDQGQVQIYVVVLERTWLKVIVDGKPAYEGRANPGNAFPYYGTNQIEVITGNGSSLQIVYNQTDMGVMGIFGEVVDRIYTPNGILEPTPTVTSSPTITPSPTRTPRTKNTPYPTRTPRINP